MGSAQPRGELKMCDHGKCSCCANARETLARLLKWARYACAPTYKRNVSSSIPTMLCMWWPRWCIDAKCLNAIAYKLFVSPLLLKSFACFFEARAKYDMRQVCNICTRETYGTKMVTRSLRCTIAWPDNSQLASLDGYVTQNGSGYQCKSKEMN